MDDRQNKEIRAGRLEAGTAAAGDVRWVVAEITGPLEAVRRRLDLSPVAAAALGRSLAAAALLQRLAEKTPSRLTVEILGDGPIKKVLAQIDGEGDLRGLVGEPRVDVPARPDGKLAVGTAVGRGRLRVIREFGDGARYESQVELVSGEIGDDVAYYLQQSEQVRSAVLVGVLTRPHGIAGAGGLVAEVLPGASDSAIDRLEANVRELGALSRVIESSGLDGSRRGLLAGLEPRTMETRRLRYHCRCSRDRLQRHLVVLADDEIDSLRHDDGTVRAECGYCGATYDFRADDLAPPDFNRPDGAQPQ